MIPCELEPFENTPGLCFHDRSFPKVATKTPDPVPVAITQHTPTSYLSRLRISAAISVKFVPTIHRLNPTKETPHAFASNVTWFLPILESLFYFCNLQFNPNLLEPTFNSTDLRDHLRVTTINFNTVSGKRENNGVEVQLWLLAPSTASRLRHRQDQKRDQRGPVASLQPTGGVENHHRLMYNSSSCVFKSPSNCDDDPSITASSSSSTAKTAATSYSKFIIPATNAAKYQFLEWFLFIT
nr:hypothetical protein Iba_chr01bCG10710 [Ipomoea batatas]